MKIMQHNWNFLEIQYGTVSTKSDFHNVKFWLVEFDMDM